METTAESPNLLDFEVRTANEWLRTAKKRPLPRMLFGELWLEGEIAVMFGDTGKGKSVLATQIAESIATGASIAPLKITAGAKRVLFLDLEMNEKQFEIRYAADHNGGNAKFLHNHHRFSDDLVRVEAEITPGPRAVEILARLITRTVREHNTNVVIIDSLSHLNGTYYGSRDLMPMMQAMRALRKEHDLSILLLVQTAKRDDTLPLGLNDLTTKLLCGRADNAFAIGQSCLDTNGRYIKHLRVRSEALVYDAAHVPAFRLTKLNGNFLGFAFESFAPESELLVDIREKREWETIAEIKQLTDAGLTIRQIADTLSMSKTTVHRLLKMWRPPKTHETPDDDAPVRSDSEWSDDFPGCEEYDEALDDPRLDDMYDEDCNYNPVLGREYDLISRARMDAKREYERTGVTPRLADNPKYQAFLNGEDVIEDEDDDQSEQGDEDHSEPDVEQPGLSETAPPSTETAGLKQGTDAAGKHPTGTNPGLHERQPRGIDEVKKSGKY